MVFSLEALEARHGDALVLYHDKKSAPSIVVIDGGPPGIYKRSLRRRLESLRKKKEALSIPLMMVSHLDEDHIRGVLDLTDELIGMKNNPQRLPPDIFNRMDGERPLPYSIESLWYNGFDKIVDNKEAELANALSSAPEVQPQSVSLALPVNVAHGLRLNDNIETLELSVNGGSELIEAPEDGVQVFAFDSEDKFFYELEPGEKPADENALKFTILGPTRDQIKRLHAEWDKQVKIIKEKEEKERAQAVAYLDNSVFNLSSIVVLAEAEGKSMLLTGDASGKYVLESLKQAGLLKDAPFHVDLLKLPHHGSDRNVELNFFQTITADNYVISANGKYENPSPETLEMIVAARAADDKPFTIYLTNDESGAENSVKAKATMKEVVEYLNGKAAADPRVKIVYRAPNAPSVVVHLADPLDLPQVADE